MGQILLKIGGFLLVLIGSLIYGLLLGGVVRKIRAAVQNRIGPSVFQNFIDLIKIFSKRTGIYHGYMYFLAPIFRLGGGVLVIALVPIIIGVPMLENFSFEGDLIVVMYIIFFGSLGMALGAGESGHPYSPVGVSRGLSQMTTYEVPFALSVVILAASNHSFSLHDIIMSQQGGIGNWNLFTHPFAAGAALLAMLGMMMRSPFNIVGAPQEIPIGPPTEYNAAFLSFMFSGRNLFAVGKLFLFMNLFLGGVVITSVNFNSVINALASVIVKTFILYMWPLFIGAVFPRFRTEQSMRFFLTYPTVIGIIGVILTIIYR